VKLKPGRGGSKNFFSQHMWKTLGTKPLTSEDSTGLVQLLVEVTLIDLEASDIQTHRPA
jgi:hypothetical protein